MPATYEVIATQTPPNSTTVTVSFTSIPATYTDLVLIVNGGYTWSDASWQMRFNSDTATNFSTTTMKGANNTATSERSSNETSLYMGWYPYPRSNAQSQTDTGNSIIHIFDYTSTSKFKTVLGRSNTGFGYSGAQEAVGLWRKTPEAINRIDCFLGTYGTPYWTTTSTFVLYGIKAAV